MRESKLAKPSPEQLFMVDFITQSDAIEGIYDDPKELLSQIQKKHSADYEGHVGAILILDELACFRQNSYVDKSLVCNIQKLIVEEQPKKGQRRLAPDQIGQYRKIGVYIMHDGEKISLIPPEEVENKMRGLLLSICIFQDNVRVFNEEFDEETKLVNIADLHYMFLRIHPFVDGNGRTCRALSYYLMKFAYLEPFLFTYYDKHEEYYPCFRYPDSHLMRNYFKEKYEGTKESA